MTGTTTDTTDENERRKNSRLEIDDPLHCKKCGTKLPEMLVHGPIAGDGTEYERVELCGDCKGTEFKIRLAAVKTARQTHGVDLNPWNLPEPPEDWEFSEEVWFEWSAETRALDAKDDGDCSDNGRESDAEGSR